jgi:tetratricopeptide (TPR) repeat protein
LLEPEYSYLSKQINLENFMAALGLSLSGGPQTVFVADGLLSSIPLLSNYLAWEEIRAILRQIIDEPVAQLANLLERQVAEREGRSDRWPSGRLELGVTLAVLGKIDDAIAQLNRAVALYTDQSVWPLEERRDPRASASLREAHLQLGRMLADTGRNYSRAVSELKEASKIEGDAGVWYYLGRAMLSMIEHETHAEAESALRQYLELGAPLGRQREVRDLLNTAETPFPNFS